jgi:hypothetical protein
MLIRFRFNVEDARMALCRCHRFVKTIAAIMLSVAMPSTAAADFFLSTAYGFGRYDAAGNTKASYPALGESLQGIALGPDGYVYMVTNDLGEPSIYRFDPVTNDFVDGFDDDGYLAPWAHFGADSQPGPLTYYWPGQFTFGPYGDLFAIGGFVPGQSIHSGLLRIDGTTGAIEGQLQNNIAENFSGDIASGKNSDIIVAYYDGTIQRHLVTETDTVLAATIELGIGLAGITVGPDGLLYLRDEASNSIKRYDIDTNVIDTLVPFVPMTNEINGQLAMGDLFFGPTGDLFVVNPTPYGVGHVLRFDSQSGALLGVVLSVPPVGPDDGIYLSGLGLAVPEPTVLVLMTTALLFVAGARSRHKPIRIR